MSDYLIKATAYDNTIRVLTTDTTETVSEAQRRHNTWPTASAALGRTMTAGAMMGAQFKGNERLTITIQGGGPIGVIIVDANAKGEVRGYVTNPQVHFDLNKFGKLDVARAVGTNGFLSVVKDLGLRDNFTGRVALVSGEIGDDFTYYFARSEQIPSAVGVGVLVNPDNSIKASGGFIIQVMPDAPDDIISKVEKRLSDIPPISKLIEAGQTPEDLLLTIFGEGHYKILEKMPIHFKCQCSREKLANAISGLGNEEIQAMIDEDHGAEADCHFCREKYYFSEDDLRDLLK
ncbi:Hsp33 family molecular chaperone HslO [Terrilactibacillus sp. BCM23-1]|uniref:33 kDa chaperonin n=1 Tax=Terrilactibacillus tamarindi TaxID=2599694 RepID=A0A6N8CV18_9BACI|nr:Hsp33 family molecular chaperone HslO [Terrilactibacillus tamarindi]MTT33005.1 Hsp33 family molecular chaperone HslO [Terrilactibacillus tamarindi]